MNDNYECKNPITGYMLACSLSAVLWSILIGGIYLLVRLVR